MTSWTTLWRTFSETLELDEEYEVGGEKQATLPIVKIDKKEEEILEGEEPETNQPEQYVTKRGRKTTVLRPYAELRTK